MNHLSYYKYQSEARGVRAPADVRRILQGTIHIYRRIVLPWMTGGKNIAIAELACGHGSFLMWLEEMGYTDTTGIDSSPEQLTFASSVARRTVLGDAIEWITGQDSDSLDTIFAIDFAEHISKDDFMELLAQCSRVLKPNGRLILRLPNGDSPLVGMNLFNDITHVWTYTPNCIATLGRMHGFSHFKFNDEGTAAIRDHRWFKVPASMLASAVLRGLFKCAAKVDVRHWSPHLWACLVKKA